MSRVLPRPPPLTVQARPKKPPAAQGKVWVDRVDRLTRLVCARNRPFCILRPLTITSTLSPLPLCCLLRRRHRLMSTCWFSLATGSPVLLPIQACAIFLGEDAGRAQWTLSSAPNERIRERRLRTVWSMSTIESCTCRSLSASFILPRQRAQVPLTATGTQLGCGMSSACTTDAGRPTAAGSRRRRSYKADSATRISAPEIESIAPKLTPAALDRDSLVRSGRPATATVWA